MMPKDVRAKVAEIKKGAMQSAPDFEALHAAEDQLMVECLSAIATGIYSGDRCALLARETLKARLIPFARECA